MASYKRPHAANTMDDVVHRTASWTTTTTVTTTTTTTTVTNGTIDPGFETQCQGTNVSLNLHPPVVGLKLSVNGNGQTPGTTKETAILLLDDDSEPTVQTQPAKKKAKSQKKGSFPCGSRKWVRIPDDQVAEYDVSACRVCPRHPHTSTTVYSLAYFKHDEDGDYECPNGDCAGDVRFVCFMCRKLKD